MPISQREFVVASDPEPWEKLLSNQTWNSELYKGAMPVESAIHDMIVRVAGLRAPEDEFVLENTEKFTINQMASSTVALAFLQWIIRLSGARRILEIGTFIGVSALYFAKALPEDGEVVTIEKFDHFADIARRNIRNNGFEGKVRVIEAEAADAIKDLPADYSFDLAFIDGHKEGYAKYVQLLSERLRPGGLLIVDDALFHGDPLNPTASTDKGEGVAQMLSLVTSMSGWSRFLVPISNGILLLQKPLLK